MSRGYTDSPDAGDGESAGRVRVVILSSAAFGDGEPDIPGVECVRAAGSYEAAAELLAAPAAALVVDLWRLTGRHIRLLEIARRMEVEVLAVGAIPAGLTSEDLSGVRLTAKADVPKALGRLVRQEPVPPAVTDEPADEPVEADLAEESEPEPPAERIPASLDRTATDDMLRESPPEPRRAPDKQPGTPRRPETPTSPSALLSPDELAALLEDPS